jgi:hypothetical protein
MNPLFSVVIGNYNHGRFLETCLESALAQRYAPLEVVVVDDGSTDESRELLVRFRSRVRAILQQNVGQAGALSVGVRASRGEFVGFLDADDGWHADKVDEAVEALRYRPRAGWLRHKLELVDEALHPLDRTAPGFKGSGPVDPDQRHILERVLTAPTSSIVVRRSALSNVFPLPSRREFSFDADLLILARLFTAGVPGYSLDRTLGFYRRHGGQRFVSGADVPAMLRRELSVADGVARVMGMASDKSVASAKHRTVLAALEGVPWWHLRRLAPFAQGVVTAVGYAGRPRLAARQLGALVFAGITPRLWLRKLERSMPLAGSVPPSGSGAPTSPSRSGGPSVPSGYDPDAGHGTDGGG